MDNLIDPIGNLTEEQENKWKTEYPILYEKAIGEGDYIEETNQLYSTEYLPEFLKGLFKDPEIDISNSQEIWGQ